MRSAVQREYPETEADKPEHERLGHIPPSVEAMLDEADKEKQISGAASTEPSGGGTLERPKKNIDSCSEKRMQLQEMVLEACMSV